MPVCRPPCSCVGRRARASAVVSVRRPPFRVFPSSGTPRRASAVSSGHRVRCRAHASPAVPCVGRRAARRSPCPCVGCPVPVRRPPFRAFSSSGAPRRALSCVILPYPVAGCLPCRTPVVVPVRRPPFRAFSSSGAPRLSPAVSRPVAGCLSCHVSTAVPCVGRRAVCRPPFHAFLLFRALRRILSRSACPSDSLPYPCVNCRAAHACNFERRALRRILTRSACPPDVLPCVVCALSCVANGVIYFACAPPTRAAHTPPFAASCALLRARRFLLSGYHIFRPLTSYFTFCKI